MSFVRGASERYRQPAAQARAIVVSPQRPGSDPYEELYEEPRADAAALLGEGRYGSVRVARARGGSGELVAVRVVRAADLSGGRAELRRLVDVHDRLRRDVREVCRVPVLAVCLQRGAPEQPLDDVAKFVFGLCDGGRYLDVACDVIGGAFRERDARRCVAAVLRALRACHDAGLTHRQVRLEHILCRRMGCLDEPLLGGFGCAASVRPRDFALVPDEVEASPCLSYVAPELCGRDVEDFPRLRVLPPVDVWAVGCVLHVLLLGRAPLEDLARLDSRTARRARLAAAAEEQRSSAVVPADSPCSPAARDVLNTLLVIDHAKRPACGDALAALDAWAGTAAPIGADHLSAFRARKPPPRAKPRAVTVVSPAKETLDAAGAVAPSAAAGAPSTDGAAPGRRVSHAPSPVARPRTFSQRARSILLKRPSVVEAGVFRSGPTKRVAAPSED